MQQLWRYKEGDNGPLPAGYQETAMTDATHNSTSGSARKSGKAGADRAAPFGLATPEFPTFEMPKFDASGLPAFEVPPALREMAETGLAQMKAGYDRVKTAAEEANAVVEETLDSGRAGIGAVHLQALDALKANTDAGFAHARALIGAKSLGEVVELQTGFLKAQYEAYGQQAKVFGEAVRKAAEDVAEPARAAFGRTLRDLKLA
jgi:phasin